MKRLSLVGYAIALLLVSCGSHVKMKDLETLTKSSIVLDERHLIQYTRGELLDCRFEPNEARLLIIYDSMNCSACRVNDLINLDELYTLSRESLGRFAPVVLFSPSATQYDKLIYALNQIRYSQPVFIDNQHVFYQDNPGLNDYRQYNSFLLDKNNHIVLVGNPLDSETMWNLFKLTLDNLLAHDGVYVPDSH